MDEKTDIGKIVNKELEETEKVKLIQRRRSTTSPAQSRGIVGASPQEEENKGENKMSTIPNWKAHLDYYNKLRALKFQSKQGIHIALELLESDALRSLPFDIVADYTIVVPAEAVQYFKDVKDLQFEDTEVLSADDIPPEEVALLRREQGPY